MDSMVVRRSAADWSLIIAELEASGKSTREFAARRGLNASTLGWWRTQLRRRPHQASFVEVEVTGEASQPIVIEVARTGHRVVVPLGVDLAHLRRVVNALC